MKKFFTVATAVLLAATVYGQGHFLKMTTIPSRPTFSSPATVTIANQYADGLFAPSNSSWGTNNSTTGRDIILTGKFPNGFSINLAPNSLAIPLRISNFDSTTRVGAPQDFYALYYSTSSDVLTPNSVAAPLNITVTSGKLYLANEYVTLKSRGSPAQFITGKIVTYTSSTGAMQLTDLSKSGASSLSDWDVIYDGVQHGMQGIGGTNYTYVYGKSPTEPFVTSSFTNNGFQWLSVSSGATFKIQNVVAKYPMSSLMTANNGTGTATYTDEDYSFMRSFKTGQEGVCYIGTTHTPYDDHGTVYVHDCYSWSSCRECVQVEHINSVHITKITGVLSGSNWNGTCGGAGQNNSLQCHDLGPGSLVDYCLFVDSPIAINFFTHGTTVRWCFFSETSSTQSYIGRTDNAYFSASPRLTGDSLIFDHCYFKNNSGSTKSFFVQVAERVAHIQFRNCTFDGYTAIADDQRVAGYTNTITGTIGTLGNVSATIPTPTFKSTNSASDYTHHGLLQDKVWYFRHMGYRVP